MPLYFAAVLALFSGLSLPGGSQDHGRGPSGRQGSRPRAGTRLLSTVGMRRGGGVEPSGLVR
jgi:hypothetical protein